MRPVISMSFSRGWNSAVEQCAAWHDEREAAMREVYRENRGSIDREKVLERANWHRDCAGQLRKLTTLL